jgi:Leu/Phe-tRNA-protein transferase
MDFQVNCGYDDQVEKAHQIQSIVKAVNQGQIPRDSYRDLAAANYHLPRENTVSNERIAITNQMNQIIKIATFNIKENNDLVDVISEEPDISNPEIIQEVVNTMEIGIYRSAKDILS